MDKSKQQIPGFGFDPGYEPTPLPQQPAPSSNSIFGVISKVNKGLLNIPQSQTPQTGAEKELQSNIQQARAVAKKLSDISPQDAKQRIFLNAKNKIENIQKGIWNPPASQANTNRQGLPNTGFKVPAAVSTSSRNVSIGITQGHSIASNQDKGQKFNILNQQISSRAFEEEIKQSVFENIDRSKQASSFTHKEALDEIDRYRGAALGTNRDQTYEDTSKKSEPFKSDFDRYYYGDETQRSEISGRLHRPDYGDDGYSLGNDIDSKPVNEKNQWQGPSYDSKGNARLNDESQACADESQQFEYSHYKGIDNNQTQYGAYHDQRYQQSDEKYYQRNTVEVEKGFEAERESHRRNEYDPERWHYSGRNPNYNQSQDSRKISSGYYDNRLENKKSQLEEDTSYVNSSDPFMRGDQNRIRPENEKYNCRRESQERYDIGHNESRDRYSQSPKVFDYDHTTLSRDRRIDSYQARRDEEKHEERFDDRSRQMNREIRGHEIDRDRDTGYRNRDDERSRYHQEREYHHYTEGEREAFYDNYYQREQEDRFDARNEEHHHYDDDMANMEEFPEEAEHSESKSQDGRMLYEEYLFQNESEDSRARGREDADTRADFRDIDADDRAYFRGREDDREQRGRQYDSGYNRKHGYEDRTRGRHLDDRRSRDNSYESFRSSGSDTREERQKTFKDDNGGRQSKERFDGRKDDFGKVEINLPITDDQKAQGLPSSSEPMKVLPGGVATHGPPPSVPGNQVLPLSGTGSTAPPPRGVPPPAVAVIPPPGIICNDCNVTCLDEAIYKAHLTSDAHILTLQRKAQELFQMESRPSRFDVDSSGKPLKASILPPSTIITGIPTKTLAKPAAGMPIEKNVYTRKESERETRQDMVSRYRATSDSDVQVIPPKPLGPLETRSVHCTWLILEWRTRHEDEEALIDKYVIEYRNAREIRWVRVGATTKHEFEVNGLQEGTDYLFRVYTTNKDERSEYLESVLITTRRDSSERGHRLLRRDRTRDSGRRSVRELGHHSSREKDRKNVKEIGRKSGNRRSSRDRKLSRDSGRSSSTNRKSSDSRRLAVKRSTKDTDKRESKQSKDSQDKSERKELSSNSEQDTSISGDNKEKETVESIKVEEEPEKIDVDTEPEKPVQEEVECLLYRELPNYIDEPMLGLDNIYEIRSYLPKTPPRYVCKLCNNKGSHKIIVKHIIGFPHKLNYFKKNNPEIFDVINVIALKKQQVERANYEARLEEDRKGRGSVCVMLMLNPEDNNGKTVYQDPIPVKAPPPLRSKETGDAPELNDVSFQSQFDDLYNNAIKNEGISDSTLIGLDYIKEMLHPRMEREPKYTCSLCSLMCHKTTILSHILGKKHRTNYLRVYHEDAYAMIMSSSDQKRQLSQKIKEFAEKDGTGTIRTKVARHERMWRDKASKNEEDQMQEEMEAPAQEEEGGNEDESQQEVSDKSQDGESRTSSGVQAIKFGIKKTEAPPTNVKPINVLDQELAVPKHKEAFDWTKENDLLQSKIHNETIIKCSRKSKFITVYSEFFKRYPVIGIQWVTEFQKQDVKQEPWYMCSMCQLKLQWKNILDHVTSNLHRLNYMKKSDYRQMYNAVYHAIKKDKQSARPLIEQYSKEISSIEGPPTQMEVMLELKVNKEAFKSVAKVQENVKAHTTAASSSQPSSIQINIASTSLSSKKVSGESTLVTVESGNDPKSQEMSQPSLAVQNAIPSNTAPVLHPGAFIQQQYIAQPQTVQPQVPSLVQQQAPLIVHQQVQPPPLQAPLIRPPPLRPQPSAAVSYMQYPQHHVETGQVQSVSMATALSQQVQYQNAANIAAPPLNTSSVPQFSPLGSNTTVQVQQMPALPTHYNSSVPTSVRQPLLTGPRPIPSFVTTPVQRPPPMPYPPMVQGPPANPVQTSFSTPSTTVQQPASLPVYSSTQPSFPSTHVASTASSVMPSTNQSFHQANQPPMSIGQRPQPWQTQTSVGPPLTSQYVSVNVMTKNNVSHLNTCPQYPNNSQNKNLSDAVKTLDSTAFYKEKTDMAADRQRFDKSKATSDEEKLRYNKQYGNDFDGEDPETTDQSDKDRGMKRYSRESRYTDGNKRLRNEDRRNDMKPDKVSSPRRSPSFGRSRDYDRRKNVDKDFNRRKDQDFERGNIRERDRRRSRSPYRSDRRSPPRDRQRDDQFGNRSYKYSGRSDRRPSPRRESDSYRREKQSENHPEERRRDQSFYRDEVRIPSDDFNEPLNEAKVNDLVERYSGRVDEEYDTFMENEAGREGDRDIMDGTKFGGGGQENYTDYETYDERYHNERQTYRNEFDNQENFENPRDFNEDWYEKAERTDNVYSGRRGMSGNTNMEFRDKSNRSDNYSRQDSNINRTNRGQEYHTITDETRRGGQNVYLSDRKRDRAEVQESRYSRDVVKSGEDLRQVEDWHYRENDRNQRNYRHDYSENQNYNIGGRNIDDTFGNRMSTNMEVSDQRQSYGDSYGRIYEEPRGDDDILPDPSREEIEALLRRANTVATPPASNFDDYMEDAPIVQTRQGGSSGYTRGNRGRGGYRGRGNPRSSR